MVRGDVLIMVDRQLAELIVGFDLKQCIKLIMQVVDPTAVVNLRICALHLDVGFVLLVGPRACGEHGEAPGGGIVAVRSVGVKRVEDVCCVAAIHEGDEERASRVRPGPAGAPRRALPRSPERCHT